MILTICSQTACVDAATNVVWWPGREAAAMCLKHTTHAQGIADAMGFSLRTQSLVRYAAEVIEDTKIASAIKALEKMKE